MVVLIRVIVLLAALFVLAVSLGRRAASVPVPVDMRRERRSLQEQNRDKAALDDFFTGGRARAPTKEGSCDGLTGLVRLSKFGLRDRRRKERSTNASIIMEELSSRSMCCPCFYPLDPKRISLTINLPLKD